MDRKNAWEKYPEGKKRDKVFKFAEKYRRFISECKTERECTAEFIKRAEKAGFVNLEDVLAQGTALKAGNNDMNARIVAAIVEDPDAAPAHLKPPPLLSARFSRLSALKLKKGCAASFVTLLTVKSLRLTPAHPSGFRSRPVCTIFRKMRL